MADYDIIRVFNDIGYSKWDDIHLKDMKKCYQDYNKEFKLPDWGVEQERFY
jgi:hypothetical protein